LAVGASTPARGFYIGLASGQATSLVSGTIFINVLSPNFAYLVEQDPIRVYENLTVALNETYHVNNKVVILDMSEKPDVVAHDLVAAGAAAIVSFQPGNVGDRDTDCIAGGSRDHE
jgi:hypothetical protein